LVAELPDAASSVLTSPMMVSTILLLTVHPLLNVGLRRFLDRRRAPIEHTTDLDPQNVGANL
ncbi:hypothetical protein SB717_37745, partial [Priestia sp. SIMBA_032]|uniref:hypothetical protein n=1 Tax=Priestia sp. SIMBA_032 TaxID=3085775 RepID=UPI003977FA17